MRRKARVWAFALVALAILAAAWGWRAHEVTEVGGVPIEGGDGGGLPRAEPQSEGFDAERLRALTESALQHGNGALLVMRHGHLVYERYGPALDAAARVDGGKLSDALLYIAAGIAVSRHGMTMPPSPLDRSQLVAAIAASTGRSYPSFLSRQIWQPLHAARAYWRSAGVSARCSDWLRVGELLLHDGRFEGTQIGPPGWIAVQARALFDSSTEAPAPTLLTVPGPGSTRLWLAPRLDVAILRVADAPPPGVAIDESLARTILATVRDRPGTGGSSLNDLVPGH